MKTEKHTSYYKLLEALTNHQGCALCFLEENAVRSYFTSVLHENVNDPGTRSSLWQSKGYCRIHAQMLASMGDGLGVAILYEDLFAGLISDLETMKASGTTSWKRPFRAWLVHTDCPACQKARDATERYGSLLFAAVEDAELRETLEKSSGLCLPHLAALLTRPADARVREYILQLHVSKYRMLLAELREFRRKHDYRFRSEGFGAERDAWLRVVRTMTG